VKESIRQGRLALPAAYSSFTSGVCRIHAPEWLFPQVKATLHADAMSAREVKMLLTPRSLAMTKIFRSQMVLAVAISLASAACFAQSSGEATYKAKCQTCHGATGTPSAGMAKAMGIKASTDPAIKALTAAQMADAIKNGKGKMKPIAGLTDAQIKDVVTFYRGLK
jgi:mono/diheme cytochrome c family protein